MGDARKWRGLVAILVLWAAQSSGHARVIYVDGLAEGLGDGSSWTNAYKYLQDALADANSAPKPVQIRVAQGAYRPDRGGGMTRGDREATFQLVSGLTILGGYAGTGQADPNARDIHLYETILSGDLNGDDAVVADACDLANEPTRVENSYNVVTGSKTDATAVLDGVTITGGNDDRSICPDPWNPDFCMGSGQGGGMHNKDGSPTVSNCTFTGNAAFWDKGHPRGGFGGAMFNGGDSSPTITNCIFSGNWAETGGGINNDGGYCRPVVTNCIFSNNAARYSGGAMHNSGGGPIVTSCTFDRNAAANGAGASNIMCDPTFSKCAFSANSAGYRGGAIYNDTESKAEIAECTFTNNSGLRGGAMCCDSRAEPVITACRFYENSAELGGAIESHSRSLTVTGCVFERNAASGAGGGVYAATFSDPVNSSLVNCLFVGNTAVDSGGGVYTYASNREMRARIANCTLSGNSAASGGGICSVKGGTLHTAAVTIVNCICRGNSTGEIVIDGQVTFSVTYTDVEGGWPGYKNIDVDPCFADPANGDYHLRSEVGRWDPNLASWVKDSLTSPCIDAGSPMSQLGDEPWPHGKLVNMGAYGGTAEAGMSSSDVGNVADLNNDDIVSVSDLARMGNGWEERKTPSVADLNRNATADFQDVLIFADNWLVDNRVALPCDDFNDNTQGDLWTAQANDPANCRLEEIDRRLEVRATLDTASKRAVYISHGWALDVDRDFAFRVDYHYSRINIGDGWVLIRVAPTSTQDPGNPHVEFSAGYSNFRPYYYYEVVAEAGSDKTWNDRLTNDGTFYISYDSVADELYVSTTGYGGQNAYRTASGLLHGVWGHSPVHIELGGGSMGAMLESGSACLDNFVVESGTLK
ncbi:MAG: hypothetical protein JSU94_21795 [Phycisphaerales bacterium]|nr:MAG: hypothetical protein JSU94_21795 [Phycisphaerales bacterium]